MTPTDADFDDMHHALGRPEGPWKPPYRNHFVCATGGCQAHRFAELTGLWKCINHINRGQDAVYIVTGEGIRQLMGWLTAKAKAQGLRPYIVTGQGLSTRTILAASRSAARYRVFLEISDVFPGGYREFQKLGVSPRLA